MSNLFGNLASQQTDVQKDKDVLGGRRPLLETNAYDGILETVYATKSDGGAAALNFVFKIGDQFHRQTVYITSKQGESFYTTKDDKKAPLPGYALANALTKLTIGKEIPALTFEPKMVKVYDFDARKEVTKEFQVAVELENVKVSIGIEKVIENKKVKDQAGTYVKTPETREFNEWTRVFHADSGQTAVEYDEQRPAEFKAQWVAKYAGQMTDKRDRNLKAAAPAGGQPANGGAVASKSLFGNKA